MICVQDNALGEQVEQVDRCYRARHDYSQTTTDMIKPGSVYQYGASRIGSSVCRNW